MASGGFGGDEGGRIRQVQGARADFNPVFRGGYGRGQAMRRSTAGADFNPAHAFRRERYERDEPERRDRLWGARDHAYGSSIPESEDQGGRRWGRNVAIGGELEFISGRNDHRRRPTPLIDFTPRFRGHVYVPGFEDQGGTHEGPGSSINLVDDEETPNLESTDDRRRRALDFIPRSRSWRGRGRGAGRRAGLSREPTPRSPREQWRSDRPVSPYEELDRPPYRQERAKVSRGGHRSREWRGRGRARLGSNMALTPYRGFDQELRETERAEHGEQFSTGFTSIDDDTDSSVNVLTSRGSSYHTRGGVLQRRRGGRNRPRLEERGSSDNPQWHNRRGVGRYGRGGNFHSPQPDQNIRARYTFTATSMLDLSTLDSEALVKRIDSQLKEFQQAINKRAESMDAVVKILSKLTNLASKRDVLLSNEQRTASRIVAEILSERSEEFHMNLKRAVKQCGTMSQITCFCNLFLAMLTTFESSAWSCLPIDELHERAKYLARCGQTSPVLKISEELLKTRDQMRDAHTSDQKAEATNHDDERDDSKFRLIPLLPEWKEINRDNGIPPEVRPNRINTRYKNWLQYYDIQFRLVREDFVAPLRRGVTAFLQGNRGGKNRDVKMYSGAVISSQETTRDKGICFRVTFDVTGFRRVNYNWNHSKRLLFGSLLCFIPSVATSEDKVLFATVVDRRTEDLNDGHFMVQLFGDDIIDAMTHCIRRTKFEIVESNSYFEAISPVLQSIQKAEVDTMPFTTQLIEGKCDVVAPPAYLCNEEPPLYNLSCLYGSMMKQWLKPPLMIDVLDKTSWEAADNTELDTSQLNAIQIALTQEIAVIQGPPGTGKTYIGLKIVESLLQNHNVWDPHKTSPIFVMCYTNHALDQFLEGIIDTECCGRKPEVIRVGGRCKNEKVNFYNLSNVRRTAFVPNVSSEIRRLREEMEQCNPKILWHQLNYYRDNVRNSAHILSLSHIQEVAHPDHCYQLSQIAYCAPHKDIEVEIWLGLWNKDLSYSEVNEKEDRNIPKSGERKRENNTENKKAEQADKESTESGTMEEKEGTELIEIEGEADLILDARMLDDDREGFQTVPLKEKDKESERTAMPMEGLPEISDKSDMEKDFNDDQFENMSRRSDANSIVRDYMFKNAMDDDEADEIKDIMSLSVSDRWRLYNYWEEKQYEYLEQQNREQVKLYSEKCQQLAELRQFEDRYVLEKADVVGMTTTGAAKYQHILHHIKPRIVIVEEAAEVLEAHIVSALNAGTQHLILIGDHKQLRPKPNEYILATKYNLAVSLFERLIRNNLSRATLEIQHRMRPEIARLVCPHVYSKLLNHESVSNYPNIQGISKNLFFVHHTQPESENAQLLSYENEFEAEYIVSLCNHLLNLGYSPSQITILTPYVGQLLKLQKKMFLNVFRGVRVTAIDNFQGEENDIILFSMVRSTNPHSQQATIGFLKENNRVCVSLSRAKHGFYAIGNFNEVIRHQSALWESIISDVESRGCFGDALPLYCCNHPETKYTAKKGSDFKSKAPQGGCQRDCDIRLSCGHSCTQKCHIVDREHMTVECKKICKKIIPSCGHEQDMACFTNPRLVKCRAPCSKQCDKGHPCPKLCYADCESCVVKVEKSLVCGHTQTIECYKEPDTATCQAVCEKLCLNELHTVTKLCNKSWPNCEKRILKVLPRCGHSVSAPCFQDPSDVLCNKPCEKSCEEGHICPKLCHEDCGPCSSEVQKTLLCGHTHTMLCSEATSDTFKCPTKCLSQLCERGHKCKKLCHFPQECEPCNKKVKTCMPVCGHGQNVPCFASEDPKKHGYTCKHPCERRLKCSHKCQGKCGEDCQETCTEKVTVELDCGHNIKVKCHGKNEIHIEHCTELVKVRRSSCGHEFECECFQREIIVAWCPCDMRCDKRLSCGHFCSNLCGDPCSTCRQKSLRRYPCGHSAKIPCNSTTDEHPCKKKCQFELSCGHTCSGRCGDCYSSRMHALCIFDVKVVRYCGHSETVPCAGLSDSCDHETHLLPCLHCDDYTKCCEVCGWNCKHFQCEKECSEECDRPPCNKACDKDLPCGHQCPGVCGERCLSVCPKCDPKTFVSKLHPKQRKRSSTLPVGQLYIELGCSHIVPLAYLDEYIDPKIKTVMPKQCPKCHQIIPASYRYGNAAKRAMNDIEHVSDVIQLHLSIPTNEREELLLTVSELTDEYINVPIPLAIDLRNIQRNLKSDNPLTSEERCFIQCLFTCAKLYLSTLSNVVAFPDIHMIMESLERVASKLMKSAKNYERDTVPDTYKLSWQLLEDFMSEVYRLALSAQCIIAKCQHPLTESSYASVKRTGPGRAIATVDTYVHSLDPLKDRISAEDYKYYSSQIEASTVVNLHVQTPILPSVIKGTWMKCPAGHCYCKPPIYGSGAKQKTLSYCPKCT